MLELYRDLCQEDQETVQKVMQDNGHFAHPENVAISCLSDNREEVRRRGVRYILEARKLFHPQDDVRKFVPPQINFHSKQFCDLIDLDTVDKTEPPVTKSMSEQTILSALATPLILPSYPNHTQRVEQLVRVVSQAATQRVGYSGRHRLILQLLKSRKLVPSFNTKSDDAVCDE